MPERLWTPSDVDGTIFCADQLANGKSLYWSIGINRLTGGKVFSVAIVPIPESGVETVQPDLFCLETEGGDYSIVYTQIIINSGEIILAFSGAGRPEGLLIKEFGDSLSDFRFLRRDLPTGKMVLGGVLQDYYFTNSDSETEIMNGEGKVRLGIYQSPESENTFQVYNAGWKQEWWTIIANPITLEDLVVFAPNRWGDSADAETVARIMKKIISERVVSFEV
ncbi:MAG: hypothetical protein V1810_00240 [Candidatus Beckwithbacteria bacterium]